MSEMRKSVTKDNQSIAPSEANISNSGVESTSDSVYSRLDILAGNVIT